VDYAGAANGRIRNVPDQRTIRYYTTIGLLDRPAEIRGRTALYSRRHLRQLVVIKRLQARGLTLSAIQQQLLGMSDAALCRLAKLPEGVETANGPALASGPARESFWMATPAELSREGSENQERDSGERAIERTGKPAGARFQGIPLNDAVMLLIASVRPVDDDDIQAIRAASAPLMKLLERRRLLGPAPHKENT
jgi:DNA-binding transcriptional MerR regulator